MVTLLLTLIGLLVLGVLTHVAPPLRRGRTGYPSNLPAKHTAERREGTRTVSRGTLQLKELPCTRQALEL